MNMETSSEVEYLPPPISTPETKEKRQKISNVREEKLDGRTSCSQPKPNSLPEIWKLCVGNLCSHLAEIETEWSDRWEELQKKEDEELKNLACVAQEAEELNQACNHQIESFHSSLLNLASSFQN